MHNKQTISRSRVVEAGMDIQCLAVDCERLAQDLVAKARLMRQIARREVCARLEGVDAGEWPDAA